MLSLIAHQNGKHWESGIDHHFTVGHFESTRELVVQLLAKELVDCMNIITTHIIYKIP